MFCDRRDYILVAVDTVLIILEGGDMIAVVTMVLPLIVKVAVVVIF